MARTLVAIYDSVYIAKKAVGELLDLGHTRKNIILRTDRHFESSLDLMKSEPLHTELATDEIRTGSLIGAGIGGSLGLMAALMASLGSLSLPFLDGMITIATNTVMKIIVETILLAGIGMFAGGFIGSWFCAMVGFGIPEDEIQQYAKIVRRSKIAVIVKDDWAGVDGTIEVLERFNPLDIQQRPIEWKTLSARELRLADQRAAVNIRDQHRS